MAAASSGETFELLAMRLMEGPTVFVIRVGALTSGTTKWLTGAGYWLNTQRDPFGIYPLTIAQSESPASFYKKKKIIGVATRA